MEKLKAGFTHAEGGEIKYNIIDNATKNVIESYSDSIKAEESLRELNLATKQDWGKKDHYTIEIDSTYAEGGSTYQGGGEIKSTLEVVREMFENSSLAELNKHTDPQASTVAFMVGDALKTGLKIQIFVL
jgi:hypothetical protein